MRNGREHVIPKALGGSFTIDRVCQDCDNALGGTADQYLIQQMDVQKRRIDLVLKGQRGGIPEKHPARIVNVDNPSHHVRLETDPVTGNERIRTVSRVEFKVTKMPNGTLIQPVNVHIDMADRDKAFVLARKALRNAGLENDDDIERIASEFAASLEIADEVAQFYRETEIQRDGQHQGLLKVAYELAWYWLGDAWLYDPVAISMRDMLQGRTAAAPIQARVYNDPDRAIMPVGGDPRLLHVAFITEHYGRLFVFIRLFDVFTAGFVVTGSPTIYSVPVSNAVIMHVKERQYDEVTFEPQPGRVAWTHDPATSRFS